MPVDYGYIFGTLNRSEGDEIDALIISSDKLSIGQKLEIKPIAIIMRDDGDDKIVAVDRTTEKEIRKWEDIPRRQRELITNFFSYRVKFKSIKGQSEALQYVKKNKV